MRAPAAPGRTRFGPLITEFDARADALLEQVRGTRPVDVFFTAASHAGEFSLVWHVANVARGSIRRRPDQVVALALALGAESLLINQGLKRVFRRPRPTVEGDPRTPVRRPLTSSFPSGHASAAAFNATVLTAWDPKRATLWWTLAGAVATSRVYVRLHHASDVVGGLVVGAALGLVARRVIRAAGIR